MNILHSLVSEREVDPVVQLRGDLVRLQRRPVAGDETSRRVRPAGQLQVGHVGVDRLPEATR